MNTITFNTGRGYSTDGQEITATVLTTYIDDMFSETNLIVLVNDKTRNIKQYIDINELTETAVMRAYDNRLYIGNVQEYLDRNSKLEIAEVFSPGELYQWEQDNNLR